VSTLRGWLWRIRGLFGRQRAEREFSAQLESDRALYIDECVRSGATLDDARRAAAREFGSMASTTEAWRDQHGVPFLERLQRDASFAFRLLRRNRAWATVGVVSLALGAGAGAAVFSTAALTLLRGLPVPQAERLVALRWQGENKALTSFNDYGFVEGGILGSWFSPLTSDASDTTAGDTFFAMRAGATMAYDTFTRMRAANRTLETVFAFAPGPPVNLIVDGHGDVASTQFVSGDFFTGLRIPPAAGRSLVAADDRAGAERVAVISHAYWLRRFGGSSSVVGKQVRVNAVAFTIVGVAGAALPDMLNGQGAGPDVVVPLATEPAFQSGTPRIQTPTTWWLIVMGRLAPGRTAAQVEANLAPTFRNAVSDAAAAFLTTLSPEDRKEASDLGFGIVPRLRVVSAARGVYDPWPYLRAPILILAILAGIVLVVVCANLTNLSMALTTERQRELTVRQAMGATRARVARQILTEHAVMAIMGGAFAGVVAYLFQQVIRTFLPAAFDWRVVALAFVLALASGMVIGVMPAVDASRIASAPTGALVGRRSRLAAALLVAQVSLSLVLLVGSGLFMRTLGNLQRINLGFESRNLLTFTLDPSTSQYDQQRATALLDEAVMRLDGLPGVSAVTFSSQPLLRSAWNSTDLYAENAAGDKASAIPYSITVRGNFFDTMGIRVLKGRSFTSGDGAGAPLVAVLSESLARRLFGTREPIGRRFGTDSDARTKYEVVGVVAETRSVALRRQPSMTVYWPQGQSPEGARTIELRTTVPPDTLMPAVRRTMNDIDPVIPLIGLSTQASALEDQWARERTIAMASTTLGALALAVSMIGLFGLASYAVTRRSKEIAIRMAVGAEARTVLRATMRESLVLVAAGVVIGLAISLSTTRFLRALLFGLAPNDPTVITAAVLTLVAVSIVAGYLPARRAARIDPMSTLRNE
jgi:predicted permease